MERHTEDVARHYHGDEIAGTLLRALEATGVDPATLNIDRR